MKKINVMGINYEIIQLEPTAAVAAYADSAHFDEVKSLIGEEGQHFAGLCDAQSCKIYININLPYEKKVKTLIHEFVEALDQESCTELEHVKMQAITNAFFMSGIVDVEELLKVDPEDLEISIDGDSA